MIQVVTIDGPAGAGKSTVARSLAARLGWRLLDTGAMYRAVTLAALRGGTNLRSEVELRALVHSLQVVVADRHVLLNGEDVTAAIRTAEVTRLTCHIADSPAVRSQLVAWQRTFAATEKQIVSEGRDQGTIVFPAALRKYFLTADDQERARRRQAELAAQGSWLPLPEVLHQVRERDAGDQARTIAPMVPADGAWVVDSTGLELDEVVSILEADVREHLDRDRFGSSPAQSSPLLETRNSAGNG